MTKMKKCLFLMALGALFSLGIIASATEAATTTSLKDVGLENSVKIEIDDVLYTVDAVNITTAPMVAKNTKTTQPTYDIELSVNIDCADNIELANDPVLYTDSGDKLAIDNLSFSGSAMSISASCDEVPHEITLNMPMVRKLTTDQVIVKSVTGLESDVVFHEQDGVTTLELVYAPEDLPVLPRLASMIYTLPGVETPVTLNCVVSNQFYDTEGNVISGRLLFIVPDNFVCPDTYDLLLKGTVELVDTVSTDIQIKR